MNVISSIKPSALAVDSVSHAYGSRRVLHGVSLTVPQGQFTAVLGLNGAGKTTLLSLITRLFDTQSGTISVFGHRIDRAPGEALRRLGVVFQARTLDLDLSVMDNLLFHAALHGIGGGEARRRAETVLTDVDLLERRRDKARNLSGGQMRRVEIARALLHEPRLLVLDEPTVGLDIASKLTIVRHVRRLVRERGVGVLWTTHLLDEVEPDDNVLILHQGSALAHGVTAEVVAASGAETLRAAFAGMTESA
ncbi:ABC transporter ATP-binding protein [Rhodopila sp.]|uniref:ABC transporter ATP-binding protein n=1 Tax=Rhodopila sp. TaxID=2480087 RepID=UPI003D100EB3